MHDAVYYMQYLTNMQKLWEDWASTPFISTVSKPLTLLSARMAGDGLQFQRDMKIKSMCDIDGPRS